MKNQRPGIRRISPQPLWIVGLFFLMLPLLVACDSGGGSFGSQSSLQAMLERKSGLIAFTGIDGNIYTVNQGGGKLGAITNDAQLSAETETVGEQRLYLLPTWSTESRRLAFARVTSQADDEFNTTIFVSEPDGNDQDEIYFGEGDLPVYLYWVPQNERVSFITSNALGGLTLNVAPTEEGETQVIDAGQPLYWVWAPNGQQLLIHDGGNSQGARLSLLTPQDRVIEAALGLQPGYFQAPAWSPNGHRLLVSAQSDDGDNSLVLISSQEEENIASFGDGSIGFAWSPTEDKIAYISGERVLSQGVLGPLKVLDLGQPKELVFASEEQAIAFFWSPNGKKIAYLVPTLAPSSSEGQGSDSDTEQNEILLLGLYMIDVSGGESKQIRVFRPTPEFLSMLQFFDQYHRSHTIWSPDSQNVVVSALVDEDRPSIWVVNASGSLDPRYIADGTLAFWSWN